MGGSTQGQYHGENAEIDLHILSPDFWQIHQTNGIGATRYPRGEKLNHDLELNHKQKLTGARTQT